MIKKISFCLLFMIFALPHWTYARTALDYHCSRIFEETGQCPDTLCKPRCYGGIDYPECDIECFGKECTLINPSMCPKPTCQLVRGCNDVSLCLPDETPDGQQCGDLGYVGDGLKCCDGLQKRCGIPLYDGTCDQAPQRSIYAAPMCLPCGNGICDTLENRCNCPEDCPEKGTSGLETE